MVLQTNYIPHFFVLLISQSFTTSFALDQRSAALEFHEKRTVTFFKFSRHLQLLRYSPDKALCDVKLFFVIHIRGL